MAHLAAAVELDGADHTTMLDTAGLESLTMPTSSTTTSSSSRGSMENPPRLLRVSQGIPPRHHHIRLGVQVHARDGRPQEGARRIVQLAARFGDGVLGEVQGVEDHDGRDGEVYRSGAEGP